mgnify:CR=1 FL=1
MIDLQQKISNSKWEIPFQVGLNLVVFLFFSVSTRGYHDSIPQVESFEIAFFTNYAVAALVINYFLFPKFLYQKKYWLFLTLFLLVIFTSIFMEEFILEKIYFPTTRGSRFGKIIFSLVDVLPVTIILCGFKLAWDIIRKQLQLEQLTASVEQSELKFLKSQINPHFMFNNLNNIYALALENSPKTPEIILGMSSFMRYVLYECKSQYVLLKNEIEQLENYIELYEMQIEGRGKVFYHKSGIGESSQMIAPLILMVFVENAFKHSAEKKSEGIEIHIHIILDNNSLRFNCKNNYDPIEHKNNNNEAGIGLENVQKRLQFIYPNSYELTINKSETVYDLQLTLNLNR